VLKLRWRISHYKLIKRYVISDWERILGIQISMSYLWFIVRLCPYLYMQSMEDACWMIFDMSWKEEFMGMEGLRKKIADRDANGEHPVYNDDNFRARAFEGLYRWIAQYLCCKVACWGGSESITNDRKSSFVISSWCLSSSYKLHTAAWTLAWQLVTGTVDLREFQSRK